MFILEITKLSYRYEIPCATRLLHCSHLSLPGLVVSLNESVSIDYQKITAPFRAHAKAPPSYYSALHDGNTG